MRTRRPRAPINGLALDAWIIFDIIVRPAVTALQRLALAMFGAYFVIALIERTVTGFGAAFIVTGIVSVSAAYIMINAHVAIGRRIHFRFHHAAHRDPQR